ncbi:aspartyl-phosphate phosphatase Spo0E family protein [Clostridium botulinum]|nr:aspartyl-phosphate phosphatase Spo0E family protein [Clostridium botulinum]MDU4596474.1 aspartyl-phosphate phosphatase Spo0E family protein [Clostridium sporogenes]WGZ48108.1 aspartyl-phosphate phosphatase Spo0E family protein [Clostridium botulinum]
MLEIDLLIEKKREEMYLSIDKYGIRDIRTIIVSQELDELLVLKQRIAA